MAKTQKIAYKRERFTTRLPVDYSYTASHYWLSSCADVDADTANHSRIGMTQFAARMLGEIVEYDFEIAVDAALEPGQTIGWIEGFKATSDLFAVGEGTFAGANPALESDPVIAHNRPYDQGWLYAIRGLKIDTTMDVHAYIKHLDLCIDRIQASYT